MVKKHMRADDGMYHIKGRKYELLVGSRAQVWHKTAYKTSSSAVKPKGDALTLSHLKMNKHGRVVSLAKSKKGPMMLKRLHNKGYFTKKGKFGYVKRSVSKSRSHKATKKHRKKH